jgi:hypothetical protein
VVLGSVKRPNPAVCADLLTDLLDALEEIRRDFHDRLDATPRSRSAARPAPGRPRERVRHV